MLPGSSAFAARFGSKTLEEASRKAVALYRKALREIPSLIRNYNLELSPSYMRHVIRADFDKYKDVKDPAIVDQLVFRGTCDLEEAKLMYMTNAQVMNYFSPVKKPTIAVDSVLHPRPKGALRSPGKTQ